MLDVGYKLEALVDKGPLDLKFCGGHLEGKERVSAGLCFVIDGKRFRQPAADMK